MSDNVQDNIIEEFLEDCSTEYELDNIYDKIISFSNVQEDNNNTQLTMSRIIIPDNTSHIDEIRNSIPINNSHDPVIITKPSQIINNPHDTVIIIYPT